MLWYLFISIYIYIQNSFEYFNCIMRVYPHNMHSNSDLFIPNQFLQSVHVVKKKKKNTMNGYSFFGVCHEALEVSDIW